MWQKLVTLYPCLGEDPYRKKNQVTASIPTTSGPECVTVEWSTVRTLESGEFALPWTLWVGRQKD